MTTGWGLAKSSMVYFPLSGKIWNTVKKLAQDREEWKVFVRGLYPDPGISRQLKASREIQSLGRCRVNLPGGFSYGAFNGAAQIKPWSLLRMVEASRAVIFCPANDGTTFLDANLMVDNCFIFIKSSALQVRKEFYDVQFVKAPIVIDIELEHFGSSSFQLKSSAFVNDFPDPLFISRVASVFVCRESRQPKAAPDWWLEKFSKEITAGAKPMERLSMSGEDDSRSTESILTVDACDVDSYLHANWSSYAKYCYNAFVEHQMAKAASGDHNIDIFRHVKDMSIVYRKESSIGDSLTTRVSPHQSDPNTFYFSISKAQGVACECKIQYHPL